MEYSINILDSFPSLNKLTQNHNILIELNNKEYNLKKMINQQDTITIKNNLSKLFFKLYTYINNKKILLGVNNINTESFNFDNKLSIAWLEFKKKIEENKKEINDINFLFYDCIRLKLKISLNKAIPKSDKKIKANKSKIKFGNPNQQGKNYIKEKYIQNDIKDKINDIKTCRANQNDYLIKSSSKQLKENIKINNDENFEKDEIKNKEIKTTKNLNIEIDPQKSISHEYLKDLMIENDCLLTDNNIFENSSNSKSIGDKNLNNKINKFKNKDNNKQYNNNIADIKDNNINCDAILQNSLIYPNNFNKIFKNILKSDEENKNNNKINLRDKSFNKKIEIIKENDMSNNNSKNKKIKTQYKKTKSYNKILSNNIKAKNYKNSKSKMNVNYNNNNSLAKDNLLFGCYTLNDFYHSNQLKSQIKENLELETINKDISLKEIRISNIDNNKNLNELILFEKHKMNNEKDTIQENDMIQDYNNNYEKNKNNDFFTLKKDYDLFYTIKFIKSIKDDLIDLEFNLAIDKSIS